MQLAALGSAEELALLLQGKQTLSTSELLECFVLPSASEEETSQAGFAAAGSKVPEHFASLLQDETVFDEPRRVALLRWCTALHALPIGGLKDDRVRIKLYGAEPDDSTLPETHTCTREVGGRPNAVPTGLRRVL